jgi:antitoxin (DNA-binding transcriptional repressor) of toxin-antitoxin stability system
MKSFGLRKANQSFAHMMRIVREGEEVVLLDRGRPIAIVKPLRGKRSPLDRLEGKGLLIRARAPGLLPPVPMESVRGGLCQAVLDEREERG